MIGTVFKEQTHHMFGIALRNTVTFTRRVNISGTKRFHHFLSKSCISQFQLVAQNISASQFADYRLQDFILDLKNCIILNDKMILGFQNRRMLFFRTESSHDTPIRLLPIGPCHGSKDNTWCFTGRHFVCWYKIKLTSEHLIVNSFWMSFLKVDCPQSMNSLISLFVFNAFVNVFVSI